MDDIEDKYEFIIIDDEEEEEELVNDENTYSVVCIDVGVIHLGIMAFTINSITYEFEKMIGYDLMDIRKFPHPEGMCEKDCCLNHTKTFADWMSHVFQFYEPILEGCTKILIERQPPQGFVVIEQLIFYKYRQKSELIHPNSVHKFLKINQYDYEERKQKVEDIAFPYFRNSQKEEFLAMDRRHDIADALCLGLYWINVQKQKYKLQQLEEKMEQLKLKYHDKPNPYEFEENMDFEEYLYQFNYQK